MKIEKCVCCGKDLDVILTDAYVCPHCDALYQTSIDVLKVAEDKYDLIEVTGEFENRLQTRKYMKYEGKMLYFCN